MGQRSAESVGGACSRRSLDNGTVEKKGFGFRHSSFAVFKWMCRTLLTCPLYAISVTSKSTSCILNKPLLAFAVTASYCHPCALAMVWVPR
eukprot:211305-Amphidinium_carterae.1